MTRTLRGASFSDPGVETVEEGEGAKEEPTTSCGGTTIGVRLMTCVGILERVGRPSRPAPRRPTTAVWLTQPPGAFGGCAARRPSSGRRLVSSCDGPMPASPASIFLSISVPSTLRRHVSYTWRGRCHLLGRGWEDPLPWRRTARLSFPTVAQWRHSGGQRLVSSCDGPVPALPARSSRSRHAAGDPQTSRFLHVARSPAPWRPSGVTFPTRGAVARPTPPTNGRPAYGAAPVGGLTTATRRWSRSRFR
jgi:hypothetical protein